MALRALQGPTGGGTPVGGTGTPNTIPRWTGPSTLGDSGLIDDGSQIYTTSRVLAVNTATTLGTGLIRFQVGSASALANYQGAQAGFMLPTGSGSWVEFCENSASGTTFRISKDASTGVVLNANGKNMGFNAGGYTTAVASSQMVLLTSGYVGIGTASPTGRLHVVGGTAAASTNGAPVTIIAQSGGTGNTNGGSIVLTPGTQTGTGTVGLVDLSGPTGTGLKLPATPGNGDAQTLDCYAEGTYTPTTTGFGGTVSSATGAYTRIGRMVFCEVVLNGTAMTAAYGTAIVSAPFTIAAGCSSTVQGQSPVGYGIGATNPSTMQLYVPTMASTSTMRFTCTYFV